MKYDEISTERLVLIAITEAALAAEQAGGLGDEIHCSVPPAWPPEHWEPHVFDWLRQSFRRRPEQAAWQRYIALRREDGARLLIGTVGGFTHDPTPQQAEVGYSVVEPWQGRGYATEAATALIAYIRQSGQVRDVIAHTYPHLTASIRVMEKCGLTFDGKGGEAATVRYRLRFESAE